MELIQRDRAFASATKMENMIIGEMGLKHEHANKLRLTASGSFRVPLVHNRHPSRFLSNALLQ